MTDSQPVVHVALPRLADCGPWTTTPEPRRDIQARLCAALAEFAGVRDGCAFYGRSDSTVAAVSGVEPAEYEQLQERVRKRYPATASATIGRGTTAGVAGVEAKRAIGTCPETGGRIGSRDRPVVTD